MNNLNLLTQKTTFESVASQHLRSTQNQADALRKSMQQT